MIVGIYSHDFQYKEVESTTLHHNHNCPKNVITLLQLLYSHQLISLSEVSSVHSAPRASLGVLHPLTKLDGIEKIVIHCGVSVLHGSPGGKSFSSGSIVLIKDKNFYSLRDRKYKPSFIPEECVPSNWLNSQQIIDEQEKNGGSISWVYWNIVVSSIPI